MASRLGSTTLFLACTSVAGFGDASLLVQNKLFGTEQNASDVNSSFGNSTPAPTPVPIKLFRIIFTQSHGASYVCNTELKFLNELLEPLPAEFQSQTSCYGCATLCAQDNNLCMQEYGNPKAQFDGVDDTNGTGNAVHPELWSCTQQGGMENGQGNEVVVFSLPKRPARYELHSIIAGESTPKAWVLQEKRPYPSEDWFDLSNVQDAPMSKMYGVDVLVNGAYPSMVFPEFCSDNRTELTSDADPTPYDYAYAATSRELELKNNGHGVQIDNFFGTITVAGIPYNAKQLNFRLPAKRNFPEQDALGGPPKVVGEMHILHESQFALGRPQHLIVVTILMKLPLEGSDATDQELFFRQIGLEDLPDKDEPYTISGGVDLGRTFSEQLSSSYATLNCDDPDLTWIVLAKPADCAAKVVEAFNAKFGPVVAPPADVVQPIDNDALYDAAQEEAYEEAVAEAEAAGVPAPPPVPLHPGRARDLPPNARKIAANSGEYLAALKGISVAQPNATTE